MGKKRRYKIRSSKAASWPEWKKKLRETEVTGVYHNIFHDHVEAAAPPAGTSGEPMPHPRAGGAAAAGTRGTAAVDNRQSARTWSEASDTSASSGGPSPAKRPVRPPSGGLPSLPYPCPSDEPDAPPNLCRSRPWDKEARRLSSESSDDTHVDIAGTLASVGEQFMALQVRHIMSDAAAADLWDLMFRVSRSLHRCAASGVTCDYQLVRSRMRRRVPKLMLEITFEESRIRDAVTGERLWDQRVLRGLLAFPKSMFYKPRSGVRRRLLIVKTYIRVPDLIAFHRELHPHEDEVPSGIQMSMDGVAVSKSSGRTIQVISIQFPGCKNVYPVVLATPYNKHKMPVQYVLDDFLSQLQRASLEVTSLVADSPMRAKLLGITLHSGWRSCPYCTTRGIRTKLLQATVFPPSTMHAATRTLQGAEEVRSRFGLLSKKQQQGLKEAYPLAAIQFDWLNRCPPEWMHSVALGVLRRMFTLTFQVKTVRNSPSTSVARLPPEGMDRLYTRTRLPSELQRRTRLIDYATFKVG